MQEEYKRYRRVVVLVDAQNVFYSARALHNARINFNKLLRDAVNGRRLVRAIAYIVQTPEADQTNFRDMLTSEGYEIKIKEVRVRSDGSMKADWDMGIAIDAISMADKVDVVVLVSGDGDFVDMVNLLKSRGVVVEVYSFEKSTNIDLIKACTTYFPMDKSFVLPAPPRASGERRNGPRRRFPPPQRRPSEGSPAST
jgi:uncharacterized LabA/DUF88 family protein